MLETMPEDVLVWWWTEIKALAEDVAADRLLAEALGEDYEPMDIETWQPKTAPPDWEASGWQVWRARQPGGRPAV